MKPELSQLIEKLERQWCDTFRVFASHDGTGLAIASALVHDDGDAMPVFIEFERDEHQWVLTDRGQATSHLQYDPGYAITDNRLATIETMVENWGGTFADGAIRIEVDEPPTVFDIGDFLQLVAAISALPSQLGVPERPTFKRTVRNMVRSWLPETIESESDWTDDETDPEAAWPVDLRIWRGGGLAPVDSFYVATPEPMQRTALTLRHLVDVGLRSSRLIVHQVSATTDSKALYRLQEAAERTGTTMVPIRGEPTEANLEGVRRELQMLDVPLN